LCLFRIPLMHHRANEWEHAMMRSRFHSDHLLVRAKQRGIAGAEIDAVERYADKETRRGRGCVALWISRLELERLGPRTLEGVPTDRLKGLIMLESHDQTGITAFKNRKSKVYRRNAEARQ
jgi:hypothetical protein